MSFDVERVFTYHPPKGNQQDRYIAIRNKAKELAVLIQESTPSSREQSLSLSALQSSVQMANAAIAINE